MSGMNLLVKRTYSLPGETVELRRKAVYLNGAPIDEAPYHLKLTYPVPAEGAAQQELERSQAQIQRNQAYVGQQVNAKLVPLLQPAMDRRGANVLLDSGSALRFAAAVDVTNDVLAALNGVLTTVSTTAPAQQQNAPQGR